MSRPSTVPTPPPATARPARGTVVRSAVYEGTVTHRRPGPGGHGFRQQVRMPLVDLDEVDALCRLHPLWSAHHPAPVRFRREDYLGPPSVPLDVAVRDLVEDRTGTRPTGPIAVLTNPRTWGWLFNPISCYFCFDAAGDAVEAMVAEVTNTPWHERHAYVVGGPGEHRMDKVLHVSPFLPMEQTYRLTYTAPGDELRVHFTVEGADGPALAAGMVLRRRPATRRSLGAVLRFPARGTVGTSAGIYRQALALRRAGATFHPHPRRRPAATPDPRGRGGPDA